MKIENKREQINIVIEEHLLGDYNESAVIIKNGLLFIDDINSIEADEELGYKYLGVINGHKVNSLRKQLEEITK